MFVWLGIVLSSVLLWEFRSVGLPMAAVGAVLFRMLEALMLVMCLVVGGLSSLSAFSVEKREGLLGLLFLTDLSAREIVLGKLAVNSWVLLHGLFAFGPILCLPLLLGGVSADEAFLGFVAVVGALIFSASMGVMCSALARHEREGMVLWVVIFLMISVFPYLFAAALFGGEMGPFSVGWCLKSLSPWFVPQMVWGGNRGTGMYQAALTFGLLVQFGLSVLCLEIASRWIRRHWRDEGETATPQTFRLAAAGPGVTTDRDDWLGRWLARLERVRREGLRRYLDRSPSLWATLRLDRGPAWLWFIVFPILALLCAYYVAVPPDFREWFSLGVVFFCIHAGVKTWLALSVCRRWSEDCGSGVMELILTTPQTARSVLRGHFQALMRQFGRPLVAVMAVEILWLMHWSQRLYTHGPMPWWIFGVFVVVTVGDCVGIVWTGVRFAMVKRDYFRTVVATCGVMLLAPWICVFVTSVVRAMIFKPAFLAPAPEEHRGVLFWFLWSLIFDLAVGLSWARRGVLGRLKEVLVSGSARR